MPWAWRTLFLKDFSFATGLEKDSSLWGLKPYTWQPNSAPDVDRFASTPLIWFSTIYVVGRLRAAHPAHAQHRPNWYKDSWFNVNSPVVSWMLAARKPLEMTGIQWRVAMKIDLQCSVQHPAFGGVTSPVQLTSRYKHTVVTEAGVAYLKQIYAWKAILLVFGYGETKTRRGTFERKYASIEYAYNWT